MKMYNWLLSLNYNTNDVEQVLKQYALKIRTEVKDSIGKQPWPPKPEHLNNDYMKMPKLLTNFLNVLRIGKVRETTPSYVQRLVQSFAQDCV